MITDQPGSQNERLQSSLQHDKPRTEAARLWTARFARR
jgi:hypothetical protein